MKKISLLVLLFLLVACNTSSKVENEFKILSPTGAPAVSLIPLMEDKGQIDLVNGPENLQAALVNPSQEYDIIIAPVNLWALLASKGETSYKLHSIVTWGNLLVVSAQDEIKKVALFGEKAVPGKIVNLVKDEIKLDSMEVTWVPSVQEAQALLLSGKVDAALLAQPLVSATMAKAEKEGKTLKVAYNLQELYQTVSGSQNYPQAALLVKDGLELKKVNAVVQTMSDYVSKIVDNKDQFLKDVEKLSTDKLGIPSGELILKSFDQLGLNIKPALSSTTEIENFLKLFKIENIQDHFVK